MKIGILALQGAIMEHAEKLMQLGHQPIFVKTNAQILEVDGIIIPGGESTTIGKLLGFLDLKETLKKRILEGMPCYGTCAGMILLAKTVVNEPAHLGVMDIKVLRNAYGRQVSSFKTTAVIEKIDQTPIPLVFIRAPWIEAVSDKVNVLLTLDGHIVAAEQNDMLVTSFHPELTDNLAVHRYFIQKVQRYLEKKDM